jgi:hypothetical protein
LLTSRLAIIKLKREAKYRYENNIQLLPALKVNIIIVHPRGVVFPRAFSKRKAM